MQHAGRIDVCFTNQLAAATGSESKMKKESTLFLQKNTVGSGTHSRRPGETHGRLYLRILRNNTRGMQALGSDVQENGEQSLP